MKPVAFSGIFPILATPFDAQENLNLDSIARMVSFMAEIGVQGVTILGVLGEADRLLDCERREIIRTAVAAAGGLPIIVGASHRSTFAARHFIRMAETLGAEAVMLAPSPEPVPNDERTLDYFRFTTEGMSIPVVLQDHPASTSVHLSVPLLRRMVEEIPQITCIKEESVPSAPKIGALRENLPRPVTILTGLGALYGQFDLEAGCDGFMTGFAFPEVLIAMYQAFTAGRVKWAQALYQRFLPLIVFEQQPGVAIRKELLRRRGLLGCNKVRHPGAALSPVAARQLDSLLDQVLPGVDLRRPLEL